MRAYMMKSLLMVTSYNDFLDKSMHQGFEIDENTKQRVIGYVKAEIASQAHYYNMDHDGRIDAVILEADTIEFDGFDFTFINPALSIKMSGKVERLM